MTTARIVKDKIESYAYANAYDIINDRNRVKDPRSPGSILNLRTFVYDSDPFAKGANFSLFPYIVLELPMIEYSKVSLDGRYKHVQWSQKIIVRAVRDGASGIGNGTGRQDMLDIGDDLQELFNSAANRETFKHLNMYFTKLTKESVDTLAIEQKEVYEAVYELTYETRMQVSD